MKPEEINGAIAEALGWTDVDYYEDSAGPGFWHGKPPISEEEAFKMSESRLNDLRRYGTRLPNYYSDLNACHEMEKSLTPELWYDFTKALRAIIQRDCNKVECYIPGCERAQHISDFWFYHATAPQRCEAWLRAKGLWKE